MTDNANLYARLSAGFDGDACAFELADGRRLSYADVEQATARVAALLLDLGLAPGDRVSVVAEKSLTYIWLYLGCVRAGCVFHPLNPAYTATELTFFLGDASPRLLVFDQQLQDRVVPAADACASVVHRLTLNADGSGELATRSATMRSNFVTVARAPDDSAALLYSSGTTGTPKGIRITHNNLHANACALAATWAFGRNDVLLHVLPVYHVHGLFITLGPALLAGTTIRLHATFNAEETIKALPGATIMAGVPTYYSRLLATPTLTPEVCRNIRLFISGSAPLSEANFHEFRQRTGHTILERYGMTETGINTSNPLHGERKPGSVGPALTGVQVRVVNENSDEVASGAIGAIQVRGANVFPGYWQLPQASAKAFDQDGWFDTGDQGYLDEERYLFIVGRSKDMVISGGLNVYPKEVEREIERFETIAEAAVFGVFHSDFGEAVVAAVIAAPNCDVDETAIITSLKGCLASFKVPKRVLVMDALPRNTMGKVQKNKLREQHNGLFTNLP